MPTDRQLLGEVIKGYLENFMVEKTTMISMDIVGATNELVTRIEQQFDFEALGVARNANDTPALQTERAAPATAEPDLADPSVAEAFCEEVIDDIDLLLDEVTEEQARNFLESVRAGVSGNRATIQRNRRTTERQRTALTNWRTGVDNFMRNRR
jgi:hypothetical protein